MRALEPSDRTPMALNCAVSLMWTVSGPFNSSRTIVPVESGEGAGPMGVRRELSVSQAITASAISTARVPQGT